MVDILFISASPVKNRNNERSVKQMMKIAQDEGFKFLDHIFLSETETAPCIDCNKCKENPKCFDDKANAVNDRLVNARAIMICSPVYFGTMPAQLKALFDRTRPLRRHGLRLRNKIGAAVTIGGSRNGGQETAIMSIHTWMHIQGMIVCGDDSHYGGTLQVPAIEDDWGQGTLERTVRKVCDLLKTF